MHYFTISLSAVLFWVLNSPPVQAKPEILLSKKNDSDKIVSTTSAQFPNDASGSKALASKLLRIGKYDEIEKAILFYVSSKSRHINGEWNLFYFFQGLTNVSSKSAIEKFQQSESRLDEWIRSKNKSDNAKIAKALMLDTYAWKARGGGYSNTVSNEGWKLFRNRLLEAHELLKESKSLSNPMWFHVQQKLATGLPMPKADYYTLIQEAAKLHPDFDRIYTTAAWFLLPRWHGDLGEWQYYRDKVVLNSENNFRKEELYFLISQAALRFEGIAQFKEQNVSRKKYESGSEKRDVFFPSQLSQFQSCLMASISNDRDSAKRYFLREPESRPYKSSSWEKHTFKSLDQLRTWALEGKSWNEAKQDLLNLANKGLSDSQYELGTALFYRNKSKNMKEALSWLGKAADQGHVLAKLRMDTFKKMTIRESTPVISGWDIASGNMNLVKSKLSAGADSNVMVYPHVSALHWACDKGQLEIVWLLLTNGAEANRLNGGKLTPLDLVLHPNKKGLAPLQRMSAQSQNRIKELLEKHGGKQSAELITKFPKNSSN